MYKLYVPRVAESALDESRVERFEKDCYSQWGALFHGNPEVLKRIRRHHMVSFGTNMLVDSTCDESQMQLAIDIIVWLLVWDDMWDGGSGGALASADHLQGDIKVAVQIAQRENVDGHLPPHLQMWQQIYARIADSHSVDWQRRFLRTLHEYFGELAWERQQRVSPAPVDVVEFLTRRRSLSGGNLLVPILEVGTGFALPPTALESEAFMRLLECFADAISIGNDLLSLQNDLRDPGHMNVVMCMQHQFHLELPAAVREAVALHNSAVGRLLHLRDEISTSLPDAEIHSFVDQLARCVRVNIEFHFFNSRYSGFCEKTFAICDDAVLSDDKPTLVSLYK